MAPPLHAYPRYAQYSRRSAVMTLVPLFPFPQNHIEGWTAMYG